MNDDYLWDKSGEPDAEVEELEQILSTLKYQPTSLPLDQLPNSHRQYKWLLAVAATFLITISAAGLWIRRVEQIAPAAIPPSMLASNETNHTPQITLMSWNSDSKPRAQTAKVTEHNVKFVAANYPRARRRNSSGLNRQELDEAMKAKEQLLIALRLASEKINLAQKKVQNPANTNQIRNQHKIG